MPDPAYVGASATAASTGTKDSSVTPAWPGGSATAGHLAICHVHVVDQGTGHTPPSIVETALQGFRQLGPQLQAIGFTNTRSATSRYYYKVLAGSDTAPSFQMTGGDGAGPMIAAVISTYSNVGVIRLSSGNVGDAATVTGTGVTTKAVNGVVAAYTAFSDDAALGSQAFTDPASPTERYDFEVGARFGMQLTTGVRTTAGATGNFTATPDEVDPWTVMVMAFEETDAFPSVSVVDDFTYSDGDLSTVSGGDWAPDTFNFSNPDVSVISNRVGGSSAGDHRAYLVQQVEADGEVAAAVPVLALSGEKGSVGWRIASPATASVDGFEMEADPAFGIKAFRVDNGVYTPLDTYGHQLVAGDTFGVRFSGSTHEVFVVPASGPKLHVGTFTDDAYSADPGHVSIAVEGTTVRMDDFRAGPLVATSGIGFNMNVTAALEATPVLQLLMPGHFQPTATMTVGVTSGTPWPGGPGAGIGGTSMGRRMAIFARRLMYRR